LHHNSRSDIEGEWLFGAEHVSTTVKRFAHKGTPLGKLLSRFESGP
jgi:hypothetical protein